MLDYMMVQWYDLLAMARGLPHGIIEEYIARSQSPPVAELLPVELRVLVSASCYARGLTTGIARFPPGSALPCHVHDCGEAITIIEGEGEVAVEGRRYQLTRLDCIYVPAGVAHSVANVGLDKAFTAHTAFPSTNPSRTLIDLQFSAEDRGSSTSRPGEPEHVMRFGQAEMYALAEGTRFYDLFASRFGSVGICGGYGEFEPGASLPCHLHKFDESITIVTGRSVCQVQGRQYSLSGCDTAFVPEGSPHRFLNQSDSMMAMIWVYAGSEPERTLISADYCSGSLVWPGVEHFEGTVS